MSVSWGRRVRRVFCRGDSITVGFETGGSVNNDTFKGWRHNVDVATKGSFTLCGRSGNAIVGQAPEAGASDQSSKAHAGWMGQGAHTGSTKISAEIVAEPFDVMLLALGINDCIGNDSGPYSASQVLDAIDLCITYACSLVPGLIVGLLTLTTLNGPEAAYSSLKDAVNAGIDARVAAHVAAGRSVSKVDVGSPTVGTDGAHPTQDAAGYQAMATPIAAWLNGLP